MEIIVLQTDIAWEDRDTNFARVNAMLGTVRIPAGALLILPELFSVGFTPNVDRCADSARESELFLADIARRFDCCVLGGVARKTGSAAAANEAVAFNPDGRPLLRYRKLHPFSLAGEGQHYPAGEMVAAFEWGGFTIAPFICYDLRFPEAFRAAVELGASFFLVIANWPAQRIHHWTTLLKARAIENQAFVAGVNRVGEDPSHSDPGKSLIVNPPGEVLAEAGATACLLRASCDPRVAEDWRLAFPVLRDRRAQFCLLSDEEDARYP